MSMDMSTAGDSVICVAHPLAILNDGTAFLDVS